MHTWTGGCDKDALNKNYAPKPAVDETELASQLDEKFFKKIETAMDEIEVNKIWPGYNFKRTPMYLIRATHTPSGDLKDAESAYIINPYANISSTHTLGRMKREACISLNMNRACKWQPISSKVMGRQSFYFSLSDSREKILPANL